MSLCACVMCVHIPMQNKSTMLYSQLARGQRTPHLLPYWKQALFFALWVMTMIQKLLGMLLPPPPLLVLEHSSDLVLLLMWTLNILTQILHYKAETLCLLCLYFTNPHLLDPDPLYLDFMVWLKPSFPFFVNDHYVVVTLSFFNSSPASLLYGIRELSSSKNTTPK